MGKKNKIWVKQVLMKRCFTQILIFLAITFEPEMLESQSKARI